MSKKNIVRRKQRQESPVETFLVSVPHTLDEAVSEIRSVLPGFDLDVLQNLSHGELHEFHPLVEQLHMLIREDWLRPKYGSALREDCQRSYGTSDLLDEMASKIIFKTWTRLRRDGPANLASH